MTIFTTDAIIAFGAMIGGFLGALTGLGGGIIVVPMLVLGFGIDIRYAVGASLVCIIATSSGAAAAYVKEGYTNVRIGMLLEIATTIGALTGAFLSAYLSKSLIGFLFGLILIFSAYNTTRVKLNEEYKGEPDSLSKVFSLSGSYPTPSGIANYNITGVPIGFTLMYFAGILSALLGIGAGIVKVLAMDTFMKVPFKVSTTTSNFMIGVTAAAGAGFYLGRGYINPTLAMPVMFGILLGSYSGAKALHRIHVRVLRVVFAVVVCITGIEMIYKSIAGAL